MASSCSGDPCDRELRRVGQLRIDIVFHSCSEESWGRFHNLKSSITEKFPNFLVLPHTAGQTNDNIDPSKLFQVLINHTLLFSKDAVGRYPTQDEILAKVERIMESRQTAESECSQQ